MNWTPQVRQKMSNSDIGHDDHHPRATTMDDVIGIFLQEDMITRDRAIKIKNSAKASAYPD